MKSIASSAVLIIQEDDTFLLQLRDNSPQIFFPGKIGLFGGEIESDESPEEAAIREIYEELSIRIDAPDLIQIMNLESADKSLVRQRFFFSKKINHITSNKIVLNEGQKLIKIKRQHIEYACEDFVPFDLAFLLEYAYCLRGE